MLLVNRSDQNGWWWKSRPPLTCENEEASELAALERDETGEEAEALPLRAEEAMETDANGVD